MPRELSAPFDSMSPMDARYYGNDPAFFGEMHPYLSEEATLRYQLRVELALAAELEEGGIAPAGLSAHVAKAVEAVSPKDIYDEEDRIHHNIRAIVNCIRREIPERFRGYVHLFATSNDIMDSARAACLRDVTRDVLLPHCEALVLELIRVAREHADTPQMGRTHGRHAEPVALGYWLANYVVRIGRRLENLMATAADLRGKFSGSVGAHNALALRFPDDPAGFEQRVLARLDLRPPENAVSTQVVQQEYVADYGHALVSMFSVFANLADDFRHLMRSEIDEIVARPDTYRGRVGSSTMPHKVNPKNFENVKSLWKAFMPRMVSVYLDQISEHQRDLTNSASMRFFGELVAGVAYSARRLRDAVAKCEVNVQAVERNLDAGVQWSVAEPLYIALALDGHPDAYDASRALVDKARAAGQGLLSLLTSDDEEARDALSHLTPEHRAIVLDPAKYMGDSASRTRSACDDWESRVRSSLLARHLGHTPPSSALVVG